MQIAYDVDIAIIGGGSAAVACAAAAARAGASVFLAAPRTYLGEDVCGALRLDSGVALPEDWKSDGKVTPLRIKQALDKELVDSGVEFLFGSYPTQPIFGTDAEGNAVLRGFLMANRSGEQTVLARVIVDATDRAWFARRAGAEACPWAAGKQDFERTLILPGADGNERYVTKTVSIDMPDRSFSDFARAEQIARDETYEDGQMRAAETLFQVPPDPVICRRRAEEWDGKIDFDHLRPASVKRLYVLGGCADIPRKQAARYLRPGGFRAIASALGVNLAEEASALETTSKAEASEIPENAPLGHYDVVIIGGGTSGAPAAIGAARLGAKVLLFEYQYAPGGTATLGLIGRPYHGKKIGFSAEVPFPNKKENMEHKMEWYRRAVRDAGGEIWFGVVSWDALVEDERVKGVCIATPEGGGVITADVVIDSTGNADIAVAAGAETFYGSTEDGQIAMQGAGIPPRPLNAAYVNTDYLFVDESDMIDVWRALVGTRLAMEPESFDIAPLIQTRERRRIVADHVLEYLDQIAGRTFPDSIVFSRSDYDSHGYPNLDYFALIPHTEETLKQNHPAPGGSCYTPYRSLLPKGLEGLLVTGLGIGMKRDATALVRMQHDLANQGYAAGFAAAVASRENLALREIDVRAVQQHMIEIGSLPEDVLQHSDSFPQPEDIVEKAVGKLLSDDRPGACRALAVVLCHAEAARPRVEKLHEESEGEDRLFLARILGFWGDAKVAPELADALEQSQWDDKILQGRMAEYAHLPTPVDSLVLALGKSGHEKAVPAIVHKMETLDADSTLSHHRSVALALEKSGDPAAARALAELLNRPRMKGHAMQRLEPLYDNPRSKRRREAPLREIILARALYCCGDQNGLGKSILETYRKDLRGLFKQHATFVLNQDDI
ncbi:MAG: FAD-dependent oxidoreductase [Candidatus Sumerlaeota bacterium]